MEIAGIDRTDQIVLSTIQYTRQLEQVGRCTFVTRSRTWRPTHLDRVTVWTDYRTTTDAAITRGSVTLTSASASFVAGDVGTHVRVDGAGYGGAALVATIASIASPSSVDLDVAADLSVTAAALLVGVARFTGVAVAFTETRFERASGSRQIVVDCEDHAAVLRSIYPDLARDAEPLFSRVRALVRGSAASGHGVACYEPVAPVRDTLDGYDGSPITLYGGGSLELYGVDGRDVAAATYAADRSLSAILDALVVEDGQDRVWSVDGLGRLRLDVVGDWATPVTLSVSNLLVDAQMTRRQVTYANRVIYPWGPDGERVIAENLDALRDLSIPQVLSLYDGGELTTYDGGTLTTYASAGLRAFEYVAPSDVQCPTEAEATMRAEALLALMSDVSVYTTTLTTQEDGFEPGQSGTITLAERGLSGTHLIQQVTARYQPFSFRYPWRIDLTVTNGRRPTPSAEAFVSAIEGVN